MTASIRQLFLIIFFFVVTTQFMLLMFLSNRQQDTGWGSCNSSVLFVNGSPLFHHYYALQMNMSLRIDPDLTIPHVLNSVPHLLNREKGSDGDPFVPRLKVTKRRHDVPLVIAIPSVKRKASNYLMDTLESLLRAMNEEEKSKVLIVVLLSDLDGDVVSQRYEELKKEFGADIDSGLIDIIAPSPSFYPDLDQLRPNLGDKPDRMKWRTKQTLDFVYSMMYALNRGVYFLQLEDDVLAANQFVTKILDYTAKQEMENPDWIIVQFAVLGYIGKLARNRDLVMFINFYLMFYASKPVDWLFAELVTVRVCPHGGTGSIAKECQDAHKKAVLTRSPSLFQHIGFFSSLNGKRQPLRERNFDGFVPEKFRAFLGVAAKPNPPAKLSTNLKHYLTHTLEVMYDGKGVFWSTTPMAGDYIHIDLTPPVLLNQFSVVTGSPTAPGDVFQQASFEVLPDNPPDSFKPNGTMAKYFQMGAFDETGFVSGPISEALGKIRAVRINVLGNHTNWVVISTFQLYVS